MKRIVLAFVLLLPFAARATGPQFHLAEEPAEIRAAPSATAPVLGRLAPDGPGVAVLEPDESGSWGHVQWRGRSGWVPMQALRPAFREGPELFRVTGVTAGDTLNVREAPSASAADIGDLAPGAVVEVLGPDPEGRWGRIIHEGGNGWVSLAYLAPADRGRVGASEVPAGLLCAGTEPFWSLRVDHDRLTYEDPESAPRAIPLTFATAASGRRGYPALLRGEDAAGRVDLIVRPEACSDGMSDITYGWAAEVAWPDRFLAGCCRIDPR